MKYILLTLSLLTFKLSLTLTAQNNIKLEENFYRDKAAKVVKDGKFTAKVIESCDRPKNYGGDTISYFIGLKTPILLADTSKVFTPIYIGCSYYWNEVFNRYSNKDKISLLEELLTYATDIDLSGTKVLRYGFVEEGTPRPKTTSYTIQTEALFLITLLTMSEMSLIYNPYPVLMNIKTNKEINNDPKEMSKVFKIYRKWIDEYKKNGFKNFKPPLTGTNYKWYGGKDYGVNFRVDDLHSPGMVVGENKH